MILKTHITDFELKSFFESAGYFCKKIDVPVYHRRTHGPDEVDDVPMLHVQTASGFLKADDLMSEYVKVTLLRPVSETSLNIDQAARNLKSK